MAKGEDKVLLNQESSLDPDMHMYMWETLFDAAQSKDEGLQSNRRTVASSKGTFNFPETLTKALRFTNVLSDMKKLTPENTPKFALEASITKKFNKRYVTESNVKNDNWITNYGTSKPVQATQSLDHNVQFAQKVDGRGEQDPVIFRTKVDKRAMLTNLSQQFGVNVTVVQKQDLHDMQTEREGVENGFTVLVHKEPLAPGAPTVEIDSKVKDQIIDKLVSEIGISREFVTADSRDLQEFQAN